MNPLIEILLSDRFIINDNVSNKVELNSSRCLDKYFSSSEAGLVQQTKRRAKIQSWFFFLITLRKVVEWQKQMQTNWLIHVKVHFKVFFSNLVLKKQIELHVWRVTESIRAESGEKFNHHCYFAFR